MIRALIRYLFPPRSPWSRLPRPRGSLSSRHGEVDDLLRWEIEYLQVAGIARTAQDAQRLLYRYQDLQVDQIVVKLRVKPRVRSRLQIAKERLIAMLLGSR